MNHFQISSSHKIKYERLINQVFILSQRIQCTLEKKTCLFRSQRAVSRETTRLCLLWMVPYLLLILHFSLLVILVIKNERNDT
jgi:hypothetical protein